MFFFGLGPLMVLFPLLVLFIALRVFSTLFRSSYRRRLDQQRPSDLQRPPARPPVPPERYEGRVFALAYRLGGRLTVSDVVIETGLGTRDAEALLDALADEVRVRLHVDEQGFMVYEFPEIIERLKREGK